MSSKINKQNIIKDKRLNSKKKLFLYSNLNKNLFKRMLLKILTSKFFANLISFYFKSFFSKIHILKIVKKNNIDLNLFKKTKFSSYNDFFIREYKKISFSRKRTIFISPCEGLISIYPISNNSFYTVKNTKYHISDLLRNDELSKEYTNGYIVIFRLRPSDYHRYIFIDNGITISKTYKIRGRLHTIRPIAFKYFNVFKENSREYTILQTKNFDKVIQIEVGALCVGKINNYKIEKFAKGQEKGFFSFGGSTVILLVKKGIVYFDEYILKNTLLNKDTEIKIGQKIGTKNFII
ncbi:MAG: phosphatidylserine decarboxylase [Candidatus Phytoplasma cynodontis]|uniref:phosphatidylserine decarboxylase n=1 Tax='Cynodon dactylon' phytoplasma TaxID=295320 RepID=UPI001265B977|nr:phosphatidylserine decarboxylase ['Cynodon dactylon' phytoplasma]KAB8121703.1 phosphatidylserine decarboxylase ['Cynodon dactylon' phytoplasma]WIA07675.1 MAG: phosphatidylserine decarboxylase [Candidatus Phytoplasma cynodontis]